MDSPYGVSRSESSSCSARPACGIYSVIFGIMAQLNLFMSKHLAHEQSRRQLLRRLRAARAQQHVRPAVPVPHESALAVDRHVRRHSLSSCRRSRSIARPRSGSCANGSTSRPDGDAPTSSGGVLARRERPRAVCPGGRRRAVQSSCHATPHNDLRAGTTLALCDRRRLPHSTVEDTMKTSIVAGSLLCRVSRSSPLALRLSRWPPKWWCGAGRSRRTWSWAMAIPPTVRAESSTAVQAPRVLVVERVYSATTAEALEAARLPSGDGVLP